MNKLLKLLTVSAAILLTLSISAQPKKVYKEASELTLIGKIHDNTSNPYHRVDTTLYKVGTKSENAQVRMSAGIAVAFRTNAPEISVDVDYLFPANYLHTGTYAQRGFDLYIKKDGKWLWAGVGTTAASAKSGSMTLVKEMNAEMKECIVYLPLFSELKSVRIGVPAGSVLEPMDKPFRHRVGIFGSSFTHGSCAVRPGMTYPAIFTRDTGIQLLALGCAGNSKLQPYFAEILADADVEAFIFDSFSNPTVEQIGERLFPFIERIQEAHPGIPLIFQSTIYRENRNFNQRIEAEEARRIEYVDSLMKVAVKKYKDVYFIHPTATSASHDTSADGIHPTDGGYEIWAHSIEKPVMKILRKYGIK